MLDRTNLHYKKAIKAILAKVNKPHKEHISISINTEFFTITLFIGNQTHYMDMIINGLMDKKEISKKVDNFNKHYYRWLKFQQI